MPKNPNKKTVRRWLHLSTFGVLMGVAVVTFGFQLAFAGKVAPNTFALNSEISFEEAEKAQEAYSAALEIFEANPLSLTFRGEVHTFALEELGIKLNKTESVQSIPILTPMSSPWNFEGGLMGEKEVKASFEIDQAALVVALESRIIDLNVQAEDPHITWNASTGNFEISPEQSGWKADLETFEETLRDQVATLKKGSIEIPEAALHPLITAEELGAETDILTEKLGQATTLFTTAEYWRIDWLNNLELVDFKPIKTVEVGGREITLSLESYESFEPSENVAVHPISFESSIEIEVDTPALRAYVEENIAPEVEVAAEDVVILIDDAGEISFEGTATNGLRIEIESLANLLELALENNIEQVELPLEVQKGRVEVPAELREKGITELMETGYSSYYGSPYNRQHNIGVGIDQFDGVLIAPGEEFSFGEQLGVVNANTGYKPELVIKEGETIPEYGGGICQVSSTLFRAILFSGLPIVERHAHSYAVSYYAYPLGWGLDATVYPPAVDLVFLNDTEDFILIQAYTSGTEAYFKFYGTSDGRSVFMDGPYISNRVGAPAAEYKVVDYLEPGEIVKKDSAHNGFTATWSRTVTYPVGHPLHEEGYVAEETIVSPYRAWAAKYEVGAGTEGYE